MQLALKAGNGCPACDQAAQGGKYHLYHYWRAALWFAVAAAAVVTTAAPEGWSLAGLELAEFLQRLPRKSPKKETCQFGTTLCLA